MLELTRLSFRRLFPLNYALLFSFFLFTGVVSALETPFESPRFVSIDHCRVRAIALNNTTPAYLNLAFTLSLSQCLSICGPGYGPYPILSLVLPALADWVIPLFLLLGNITYARSSSDKYSIRTRNFGTQINWMAVISHLLANPLHFLWSLTLKLELGEEIWERVSVIARELDLDAAKRKHLCAVAYALSDFQSGTWVDVYLCPLEAIDRLTGRRNAEAQRFRYWLAIEVSLQTTALNLANARRHNKLHALLAIIMYVKDVFQALIQAKYDKSFPYHVPHTLALRQLYYWLFLAIIISGAAGGFANQWASQGFLEDMLESRCQALTKRDETQHEASSGTQKDETRTIGLELERVEDVSSGDTILRPIGQDDEEGGLVRQERMEWEDIALEPIEPWDGGNYCWMYNSGPITLRRVYLLLLVILSVGLPVAFAFYMSWSTPTVGLGDRGRMELCFMGMWIINFGLSLFLRRIWTLSGGRAWIFFMVSGLWDFLLAMASLGVLFGAFRGWFNNCKSWSAYYSRGAGGAVLDLKMRDVVEAHIYTFYLPMVAVALVIQLVLAGVILGMTRHTLAFTQWEDEEIKTYHKRRNRMTLKERWRAEMF